MSRRTLLRLPLEPLKEECRRQGTNVNQVQRAAGHEGKQAPYRRDGLSWLTADRLACALGTHPALIWGDDWFAIARHDDATAMQSREAAKDRKRVRDRGRSAERRKDSWSGVERSWRQWREQRDRVELHREEWACEALCSTNQGSTS